MQPFFMANYQHQHFTTPTTSFEKHHIAIITCEWNNDVNDLMLFHCEKTLQAYQVKKISKYIVPGSFELPYAAQCIAQQMQPSAIICFGTIIKGETKHDEVLANAVTTELMRLSTMLNMPIGLGVLTTNNKLQAEERANGTIANKGKECAEAVLKLIQLKENITII